jgi:hypothetical protein
MAGKTEPKQQPKRDADADIRRMKAEHEAVVRKQRANLDSLLLKFRWDLNAECAYEEAMGKPMPSNITQATAKEYKAIVWAGLLKAKPDITLDEAGTLIHGENARAAYAFLFEKIGLIWTPSKNPEAPATSG